MTSPSSSLLASPSRPTHPPSRPSSLNLTFAGLGTPGMGLNGSLKQRGVSGPRPRVVKAENGHRSQDTVDLTEKLPTTSTSVEIPAQSNGPDDDVERIRPTASTSRSGTSQTPPRTRTNGSRSSSSSILPATPPQKRQHALPRGSPKSTPPPIQLPKPSSPSSSPSKGSSTLKLKPKSSSSSLRKSSTTKDSNGRIGSSSPVSSPTWKTFPTTSPAPSPTRKTFPSPSSLARKASGNSTAGKLGGDGQGKGKGRERKTSGLSQSSTLGDSQRDGQEDRERLGAAAPNSMGREQDGRNDHERDGQEEVLRATDERDFPGSEDFRESPSAIDGSSHRTDDSRGLYGSIKRIPQHTAHPHNRPDPKSVPDFLAESLPRPSSSSPPRSRSRARSPVDPTTPTSARKVPPSRTRSPLEEGEIREYESGEGSKGEEMEMETTPKRSDGRQSLTGSSAQRREASEDRWDVEERDRERIGESPSEKARRRNVQISGGLDLQEDLRRMSSEETNRQHAYGSEAGYPSTTSRTLSLALEQRRSGDSPKDIRKWNRHSVTGLPTPSTIGLEIRAGGEELSLQNPSTSGHPGISRASSFVRGDDASGLPGHYASDRYPSARGYADSDIRNEEHPDSGLEQGQAQGQEQIWGRASVKEDSGGSSGSNKRRSGLPVEFRQDAAQAAHHGESLARRSTMHARYTTDSAIAPAGQDNNESLLRSVSVRSGAAIRDSGGHSRRLSLMLDRGNNASSPVRGYDQSMPSRSMSVMSRYQDEWETGSMRSRHNSMGPNGTTELDRAESRRRRATLLQFAASGLSKMTPSRPGTSLRLRDPMSEPKQAPGGLSYSSSAATLRGNYQPEAPNSAPAHLKLHRQSLSLLPARNALSNQLDSPLARYQRPMSRAGTSVAGSVMLDSASRYGGDAASRYGDNDAASLRASTSREFPLQGTPSRIYMTRLMAALRNASSSASRDMMESCLRLHENMPPHVDESTVIRHKTQSITSNADRISGHLKQALDLVAQMTVECEVSAPEEAQEIALAYGDRLKGVLEAAMRESDLQIGGMTELFASMNGMVTDLGGESGHLGSREQATSGSVLGQSTSPSLYHLPRTSERSPSLLGGASMYRPKRSSLDLRRETTVAGPLTSRTARPGSALLFRHPQTLPIDEAGSSSGSSGTRTSAAPYRSVNGLAQSSVSGSKLRTDDSKRNSILSRLRTSPLRQTTMLPGEPSALPNGSPPSTAARDPTLRRQRSAGSTATAKAQFNPAVSGRAATTAVSQVTASPTEPAYAEYFPDRSEGLDKSHRRLSSAASSMLDVDAEPPQERSRLAAVGGAYRRLSGVRGPK